MSANPTPVAGSSGPATELIQQIEAQGFKSQGKPLTKFAPWQRLKSLVVGMEKAVNYCWRIVAEVRQGLKALQLKSRRAKSGGSAK